MHRICIDGLSCGIHDSRARIAIDRTEVVGLNVLLFFIVKLLDLLYMMICTQRSIVQITICATTILRVPMDGPPGDYPRGRYYINSMVKRIDLDSHDIISSSTPIDP